VEESREELLNWRRFLHQYPELSFAEHNTAAFIEKTLKGLGKIEVKRPTLTSVLGIIRGRLPGKTVAIRADIDALALQEENDVDYRSRHLGVMHACGHDGHAAILLGTAKTLVKLSHEFNGEIRLIFQHAEETPPGGAQELVQAGVLEGTDFIFAGHLWAELPTGKIGIADGPIMAAPDRFQITINGRGGHAAHPEQTIDPIIIGTQVISSLQHIRSRLTPAHEPLVISVTQFHSGTTYNIIPDSAYIEGTVRTFDESLRTKVPQIMEKMISGISAAYDAKIDLQYHRGYNPVVNDRLVNSVIQSVVREYLGEIAVHPFQPSMGGEDFSVYLSKIPGAFFMVGCGNPQKGAIFPHHHPKFQIDEDALVIGTKLYIAVALKLLST